MTAIDTTHPQGIPRSGGEKTYLKFLYGRPEFLAMCIFAAGVLTTGNLAANGLACGECIPGFSVSPLYEPPDNFAWDKFWEGSTQISPNSIVTGIFTVMWSFSGYNYVNVVLGEVRDPVRTVQQAAPLALLLVFMTYTAVNIGYFAVVAKGDVLNSGRLVA
ncbi:hypothetical protein DXG01_007637 [Tephrocybe rancida]|nr:hypothetical protein DXG01_007637 [Tephrocybe rancida]